MNREKAIETIEKLLWYANDMERFADKMFTLGRALGTLESIESTILTPAELQEYRERINKEVRLITDNNRMATYKVHRRKHT